MQSGNAQPRDMEHHLEIMLRTDLYSLSRSIIAFRITSHCCTIDGAPEEVLATQMQHVRNEATVEEELNTRAPDLTCVCRCLTQVFRRALLRPNNTIPELAETMEQIVSGK